MITAGIGHVACLEATAPHCCVLVPTLHVAVYLSLVCINFIFSLWHDWYEVPCSVIQNQQEGNGSS